MPLDSNLDPLDEGDSLKNFHPGAVENGVLVERRVGPGQKS